MAASSSETMRLLEGLRAADAGDDLRHSAQIGVILSPFGIIPGHKGFLRLRHVAAVRFWARLRTKKRSG